MFKPNSTRFCNVLAAIDAVAIDAGHVVLADHICARIDVNARIRAGGFVLKQLLALRATLVATGHIPANVARLAAVVELIARTLVDVDA